MTLEHWTANMGNYCLSDRAEVVDEVTPAYGRLIAGAGALGVPAPLRARDDAWQLEVLAHPHGPRVLRACILAPDGRPAVSVAVAEGGGDGARHAWRETVAASAWFIEGCDLAEFRDPPDGPWLMGALQDGLDGHPEAFEWLGAVLPYIGVGVSGQPLDDHDSMNRPARRFHRRTLSGSARHRDPARAWAALSPAASARSRDARCLVILGQAGHSLVEPLDSPPQGGVLLGLPLDLPPQGFDLFGLPPPFRFGLPGQPLQGLRQLPLQLGHTVSSLS